MMQDLCDQYSQFLQDSSGWTKNVAEQCPKGTEGSPSMLLEVHPRFPRPLFRKIAASSRHLLLVALGDAVKPDDFDRIITDVEMTKHSSGLDNGVMELLPDKATLGSVIIAHQSEFMEEKGLAELLVTAVERIATGGTVHLIDETRWNGKSDLPLRGAKAVKEVFGKDVLIQRNMIVPTVGPKSAIRIAGTSNLYQITEIMRSVIETKDGMAKLEIIPINLPVGVPLTTSNVGIHNGRITLPNYADEAITITKLTDKQKKMLKKREKMHRNH